MNTIIKYILVTLLAVLVCLPAGAKGKDKGKKHVLSSIVAPPEPDRIASKTRPDHLPAELPCPVIGIQARHSGKRGLCGFDLSHYQGRVNWDQLVTDPNCGFIYLKASEGANITDDTYAYNLREAHRVGLKVGAYHFFRATATAAEQFRNFMSMVKVKEQDLLPLIDVEALGRGVTMTTFHARLTEFLKLVEKEFGKKPMIYTGRNFYDRYLSGGRYSGYKFMIAAYMDDEPELNDGTDFLIWQFTGSGRAKGVRGHIDISCFVGNHTLNEILY